MKLFLFIPYTCMILISVFVWSGISLAERLSVKVPIANVRSSPGAKNDILWKVEKDHPLNIIKKSGSWYRFRDFEGDMGWIHKSLLSKAASVITIKKNCNVRSGPGTNFDKVFTVDKGIPFKVIKRKGNWIKIRHADGDNGWIHKTLVW